MVVNVNGQTLVVTYERTVVTTSDAEETTVVVPAMVVGVVVAAAGEVETLVAKVEAVHWAQTVVVDKTVKVERVEVV